MQWEYIAMLLASVLVGICVSADEMLQRDERAAGRCPRISGFNGKVKYRDKGRKANFRCRRMTRHGPSTAICLQNNQWSVDPPICVKTGCTPISVLSDNLVLTEKYGGALLEFTCDTEYQLQGSAEIWCDGSIWSGAIPTCKATSMLTECDFESSDLCGWSQDDSDQLDWIRHQGSTPTGGTGPTHDHTFPDSETGHYMFVEMSNPARNGDQARLLSPIYSSQMSERCFDFWYNALGPEDEGHVGTLEVFVRRMSDFLDDIQPVFSKEGNQGPDWLRGWIYVDKIDEPFQIVIATTRKLSYIADIAIDDVRLYNCTATSMLTECDFESSDLCGWSQDDSDQLDWIRHQGSTPTGGTGPTHDHTFPDSETGHYMFVEMSNPARNGDQARLLSPVYSSQMSQRCFDFWYNALGPEDEGHVGTLEVFVRRMSDFLDDIQPVFTREGNQGPDWLRGWIYIDKIDEPFQIVIVTTRKLSYIADIAIDDVRLYNCTETTTAPSTSTMSTTTSSTTNITVSTATSPASSGTTSSITSPVIATTSTTGPTTRIPPTATSTPTVTTTGQSTSQKSSTQTLTTGSKTSPSPTASSRSPTTTGISSTVIVTSSTPSTPTPPPTTPKVSTAIPSSTPIAPVVSTTVVTPTTTPPSSSNKAPTTSTTPIRQTSTSAITSRKPTTPADTTVPTTSTQRNPQTTSSSPPSTTPAQTTTTEAVTSLPTTVTRTTVAPTTTTTKTTTAQRSTSTSQEPSTVASTPSKSTEKITQSTTLKPTSQKTSTARTTVSMTTSSSTGSSAPTAMTTQAPRTSTAVTRRPSPTTTGTSGTTKTASRAELTTSSLSTTGLTSTSSPGSTAGSTSSGEVTNGTTTRSPKENETQRKHHPDDETLKPLLIGLGVGIVAGLIIIGIVAWVCVRRRKFYSSNNNSNEDELKPITHASSGNSLNNVQYYQDEDFQT